MQQHQQLVGDLSSSLQISSVSIPATSRRLNTCAITGFRRSAHSSSTRRSGEI
jgi:hypothetical protein